MTCIHIPLILFMLVVSAPAQAGVIGKAISKVANTISHPYNVYDGYTDGEEDQDDALVNAAADGAVTAAGVATSVTMTANAGAGSLAGYAGIASTVSSMGLGGVTTAIAGAMGSPATGAAATAVVTSAVGGPVVMGTILIAGSAAVTYGAYKTGRAAWDWMTDSD